jgi:Family of unknown function (DUF6325)
MTDVDTNTAADLDEMGPIDYVIIEWPGEQPTGAAMPKLLELVDSGIIRIIDIAFVGKDRSGAVYAMDLSDFDGDGNFAFFEGASSGIIGSSDLEEAATAIEPGTSAAVLIWENRWAAPVAVALRRSGAQLVASGRIPIQGILAALEEAERGDPSETSSTT